MNDSKKWAQDFFNEHGIWPIAGGSGEGDPPPPPPVDWKATLPAEFKDHPSIKEIKSVDDLAKSWVNVQKLIGPEKLPLPKDEKDPLWDTVYDRLGRPKDPSGYKLPTVDLPKGFEFSKEGTDEFLKQAHALGLNDRQVAGLYSFYASTQGKQYQAIMDQREQAANEAEQALRKEWGKGYDANIERAKRVIVASLGKEKAAEAFKKYGTDVMALQLLANVASKMSEDQLGDSLIKTEVTADEARAEIQKITADFNGPYYKADHPEHEAAIKRVSQLYSIVHGDTPVI